MTIAVALGWLVVFIVTVQAVFALSFVVIMTRTGQSGGQSGGQSADAGYHPKAAVILCLRGADPFLRDCLGQLLQQEYPDYRLCVVVDSAEDPSWQVIHEFEGHARLKVSVLHDPLHTCSLKCSSLVEAVGGLDSSFEVIALCDADTIPHSTWLAELVAPLASREVGATTGNRWYASSHASGAPLVRYLWNIPTSINMILLGIAWGGSLAIRRRVIDETGLLEMWSSALCEDTGLFRVLGDHGYRQVFVPSVMMINRESCTMRDLMNWAPRQLLTARLYHPRWPATVGYGIISSMVPFCAVILMIRGWIRSDTDSIIVATIAFAGFEFANVLFVVLSEWALRRRVPDRFARTPRTTIASILKLPFWITATQLISPLFFLKCFGMRRVVWRGIAYDIEEKAIRRGQYSVFDQEAQRRPPPQEPHGTVPRATR